MRIGHRIRQRREEMGFSQTQLEIAGDLPEGYISKLEEGSAVPAMEELESVASTLRVPLYYLFWADKGPAPTPHLTPRPSLEELACEPQMQVSREPLVFRFWHAPRFVVAAAKIGILTGLIIDLLVFILRN
jgi:transcriptional regulator with XRE-family HTH domain